MTTYVLEWSKKQNAFHIQPLENTLSRNQTAFINDERVADYIVIMVGSKESCHHMADNHRRRIVDRAPAHNHSSVVI